MSSGSFWSCPKRGTSWSRSPFSLCCPGAVSLSRPGSCVWLGSRGEEQGWVSGHSTASGNNFGCRRAGDLGQLPGIHFTAGLSLPCPPPRLSAPQYPQQLFIEVNSQLYRDGNGEILPFSTVPRHVGLPGASHCSQCHPASPAHAWPRGQAPQGHPSATLPDSGTSAHTQQDTTPPWNW